MKDEIRLAWQEDRSQDRHILTLRLNDLAGSDEALIREVDDFIGQLMAEARELVLARSKNAGRTTDAFKGKVDVEKLLTSLEKAPTEPEIAEAYVFLIHSGLTDQHRDRLESIYRTSTDPTRQKYALSLLVKYYGGPWADLAKQTVFDSAKAMELRMTGARLISYIELSVEDLERLRTMVQSTEDEQFRALLAERLVLEVPSSSNGSLASIALSNRDPQVREQVVLGLDSSIPESRSILVSAALSDTSEDVRAAAVRNLSSEVRDRETVDVLMKIAQSDPMKRVRIGAITSLIHPSLAKDDRVRATLSAIASSDHDQGVRGEASVALETLRRLAGEKQP